MGEDGYREFPSSVFPQGCPGFQEDLPMRIPWWALPGVAAILFTLAIVSAAQGSLSSAGVALPHEVQLSTGGSPSTTTSAPPAAAPEVGTVVAPSRPVVTQSGDTGSGVTSSAPSSPVPTTEPDKSSGGTPEIPGSAPSGSSSATVPPSGGGDSGDGGNSVTSGPGSGPTAAPTSTTRPSPPPSTTTSTTNPWTGREPGDN